MQKTTWTGTFAGVIACAATAALIAQTPAPQPTPAPSDQKMVVTGCLREAPSSAAAAPAPAGTTGTAGAPGAAGTTGAAPAAGNAGEQKFVLTDAMATPESSSTPSAGDPGASGTARLSYRLIANPAALVPHVGKKLELTGTLENPNASTEDTTSGPDATLPMLRVASGKIVAGSCDEKQ